MSVNCKEPISTEKEKKNGFFTIPNIMTLFRLAMIPFIIWLYIVKEKYIVTGILILVSGITDVVDGIIARKFNMVSDVGKMLDPLADKLTQLAVLICLVMRFPLIILPLSVMIAKELFVGITGIVRIRRSSVVPSADWHGKAATVCLYLMMMTHMFWYNIDHVVSTVFIIICTVLILISFVIYSMDNIRIINNSKAKSPESDESGNESEN